MGKELFDLSEKKKASRPYSQGLTRPVVSHRPFECVGVDMVVGLPETKDGYTAILTIVDHFTRWPIAIPVKNRKTITIADALWKHLVAGHGCPKKILSDNEGGFVSEDGNPEDRDSTLL